MRNPHWGPCVSLMRTLLPVCRFYQPCPLIVPCCSPQVLSSTRMSQMESCNIKLMSLSTLLTHCTILIWGSLHFRACCSYCETQLLTDQKLSSPIFACCCLLFVPHRWHLHLSPLYDVLDHTNHTFSESLWLPLSTDPLTTHPSPTQTHKTHQTHQEPT